MNTTYEQQLEQAQQKIREAERAARLSEYEAQQPQRAIADAQAELRAIQQAAAQEQYNEAAAHNSQTVYQVIALHRELIAALNAGDFPNAFALTQAAEQAHQAHRAALASVLMLSGIGMFVDRQVFELAAKRGLRQVHHFSYELAEWIGQSPDPQTRRYRQGAAWIVWTGLAQPLDYTSAYRADNAYAVDQKRQNGY